MAHLPQCVLKAAGVECEDRWNQCVNSREHMSEREIYSSKT